MDYINYPKLQSMKTFYKNVLELPIERDIPEEQFTQFKMENCFLTITANNLSKYFWVNRSQEFREALCTHFRNLKILILTINN